MDKSIVNTIKDIIGENNAQVNMPEVLKETFERLIDKKIFQYMEDEYIYSPDEPEIEIKKDEFGNEYISYDDKSIRTINVLQDEIDYSKDIAGIKIKEKTLMQELEKTFKRKILGLIIGRKRENTQNESLENLNKEQKKLQELIRQEKISPEAFAIKSKSILEEYEKECEKAKIDAREEYDQEINRNEKGEKTELGRKVNDIYNEKDWIEIMLNKFKENISETVNIEAKIAEKEGPKRGEPVNPPRKKEIKEEFSLENRLNGLKSIISTSSKINVNNGEYACFFKKIEDKEKDGYIVVMEPENYDNNATKIGYVSIEEYEEIKNNLKEKGDPKEIEIIAKYIKDTLEDINKIDKTEGIRHKEYGSWLPIIYYYITGEKRLPKNIADLATEKFNDRFPREYLVKKRRELITGLNER